MNEQREKKLCVRDCSGGAAVPERLLGAAEWSGSGTAESPTCRKAGYAHKLIPRISFLQRSTKDSGAIGLALIP